MPNQRYGLHHRICNLRYGPHGYGLTESCDLPLFVCNLCHETAGYGMSAYNGGDDKLQSFSMSCDSPILKGHTSRSLSFDYCRL